MLLVPRWYIPSFYGDIRLERTEKGCLLLSDSLSVKETMALETLTKMALKKKWVPEGVILGRRERQEIAAPIEKVAKIIAKAMKPDRRVVSAVKFSDGTMQEIVEGEYDDATPLANKGEPYRESSKPKDDPKPEAATSVARPTQGCPAPDFENADVKATRVLRAFLTPEQREDWDQHNRFIVVGAITGHRYMVTSRHAKDALAQVQRTLFDLDDHLPLCIHDWSVPAAEEALAIGLLAQLPGHEEYLRHLEA